MDMDEVFEEEGNLNFKFNEDQLEQDLIEGDIPENQRINLNKLCLLNSQTLKLDLDSSGTCRSRKNNSAQDQNMQTDNKIVQNKPNFKLDLNFQFQDNLDIEIESQNQIQDFSQLSHRESEISLNQSQNYSMHNVSQTHQKKESAVEVNNRHIDKLKAVKRHAEKLRKENISSALSSGPNLKDVKSKIQSYNTNYVNPKFAKSKSRDTSSTSVQKATKYNQQINQLQVKKENRASPIYGKYQTQQKLQDRALESQSPSTQKDYLIKDQVDEAVDKQLVIVKDNFKYQPSNSLSNLRTKNKTQLSREDSIVLKSSLKTQKASKNQTNIGSIKLKFSLEPQKQPIQKEAAISKYRMKRQDIVVINRHKLQRDKQPTAKTTVAFESPSKISASNISSKRSKSITPTSAKQQSQPSLNKHQSHSTLKLQISSQIKPDKTSKISIANTHNYESEDGQNTEQKKDKPQENINPVIKSEQKESSIYLIEQKAAIQSESLPNIASFGLKENVDLEQTFKPEVKCQVKSEIRQNDENNFFMSNTFLRLSQKSSFLNQSNSSSNFKTMPVREDKQTLDGIKQHSKLFQSIQIQKGDLDPLLNISELAQRAKQTSKPKDVNTIQSSEMSNRKMSLKRNTISTNRTTVTSFKAKSTSVFQNPHQSSIIDVQKELLDYENAIKNLQQFFLKPKVTTPLQLKSQFKFGQNQQFQTPKNDDEKQIYDMKFDTKNQSEVQNSINKNFKIDRMNRLIFDHKLSQEINAIKKQIQVKQAKCQTNNLNPQINWLQAKVQKERRANDQKQKELDTLISIRSFI